MRQNRRGDPDLPGTIYFAFRNGFVKIGFSTHLAARMSQLQRGGDLRPAEVGLGPVTLIAKQEVVWADEDRLQRMFKDLHAVGEWFQFGESLAAYIHRVNINQQVCNEYHGPFQERPAS